MSIYRRGYRETPEKRGHGHHGILGLSWRHRGNCKPTIERESGYICGTNFKLAYSPERINPGDIEHNVDKVTKIVAAADDETLGW